MKRILLSLSWAAYFFVVTSATAETPRPAFVIKTPEDLHRYVLYAIKPDYPSDLRYRHITGSGAFALHIALDGTVQSVETLKSTGHTELDDLAKSAFVKWRFRPGPTEVRLPITFRLRGGGTADWPFAR